MFGLNSTRLAHSVIVVSTEVRVTVAQSKNPLDCIYASTTAVHAKR